MTAQRTKGGLVAIAAFTGLWLVQHGAEERPPPQPSTAEAFIAGAAPKEVRAKPAAAPMSPSEPVRIRIPAVKADAPLMRLGLSPDGSLDVPPADDRNIAGWYQDGTPPGARGTAIVAGHVDSSQGPAVFYHLGTLKKGHTVEVTRRDGRTAVFTVYAIEVYDNKAFPDQRVYGSSERAELRVITCGGGFSRQDGYQGNVVAYANLTAVR
ncbi:class F sortase [Streptomyces sp. A5-4]|uniref:class F sortase n=1 Tax=Streptomyces sp. A5-4 TaxID=3384771 RepID=UPI003DA9F21E